MTVKIQTREDTNNRAMLAPPAKMANGLALRPISLGSLEILRQLGNPLATADAGLEDIDTRTLTEFLWVHAAPVDEVVETVYNLPSQVARKAALFALNVSPADLPGIMAAVKGDRDAVLSASAEPLPDPDAPESPNAPAPRP